MEKPVLLLTGATGFIGSHLLASLPGKNYRLKILTRQRTPELEKKLEGLDAQIVEGDITLTGPWQEQIADAELVVHMAVFHHAYRLNRAELEMMENVNIAGLGSLLAHLCGRGRGKLRKFILLSSIKVTEWETFGNGSEDPHWSYALTKKTAEEVLDAMAKKWNFDRVILRPTPVYGAGNVANTGRLFRAIASRRFTFIGDGSQRKSLCYVGNLVAAIHFFLEQPPRESQGAMNGPMAPLTVSDAETLDMRTLCSLIAEAAEVPPPRPILNNAQARLALSLAKCAGWVLPLPTAVRSLEAWLTESVHTPDALLRLGFVPPFPARQAIQKTFSSGSP
ncbi:MAG: NAD(P)-dependent oxidoreductase [Verrucomicrobiae bacterium]|nr:NAD(P)-dependent oxidoreductase [Verrucomicrobiae bacterium]